MATCGFKVAEQLVGIVAQAIEGRVVLGESRALGVEPELDGRERLPSGQGPDVN